MRVSGIKVLAKLVEQVRNICFWLRETKVFVFWILYPNGSYDKNAAKCFSLLLRDTKVIPVCKRFCFEFRWTRTDVFESTQILLSL